MALRGHESLVRLVGRRRRLISTVHHVGPDEQTPSDEHGLVPLFMEGESLVERGPQRSDKEAIGRKEEYGECVQCPVCSKGVRSWAINDHLDSCLGGTKKRKCTQSTLSRFATTSVNAAECVVKFTACNGTAFSHTASSTPRSMSIAVKVRAAEVLKLSDPDKQENQISSVYGSVAGQITAHVDHGCSTISSKVPATSPLHVRGSESSANLEEADISNSARHCSCICHSNWQADAGNEEIRALRSEPDDMLCFGVLCSRIVGRRFRRGVQIGKGMLVVLRREPDNTQDANAIEVVPSASPEGPALGHVPRELAVHLAPLMDKFNLDIQGTVTGVPDQMYKSVPVSLLLKSVCGGGPQAREDLEASWQNVLCAAGVANSEQQIVQRRVSKYQENFLYLLDKVLEQDSHLFSEKERAFLGSFSSLSDDAQRLFLRLYQRKGPWFRICNMAYVDIGDVNLASQSLLDAKYFTTADFSYDEGCNESGLRERLEVLNVPELRKLLSSAQVKTKSEAALAKREELINAGVAAALQKQSCISDGQKTVDFMNLVLKITGTCVRLADTASFLLWRLQRLFFLDGGQELSSFLLVDMGVLKYPSYKCQRTQHVFLTRDALVCYEQALEVGQAMDMALESNDSQAASDLLKTAVNELQSGQDVSADISNTFLARFSAVWVYATVCTLGVSLLEREKRYAEALKILRLLLSKRCCPGRRGYWTVRLSTDLEHLGRKEESLQVAEQGVNDPLIRRGDCVSLQRRVMRLGKPPRRWKRPPYADALERKCTEVQIRGRPLRSVIGVKSRFYGFDGYQCGVEELALQFYAGDLGGGWHGVHSEGGIWMTFFGILMWDVLFADIPNVFQTPFQTAPLDLDTESFYPTRESMIEERLDVLRTQDVAHLVAESWNSHYGTLCTGVNWERHTLTELQTIAECIGGRGLAAICKLLAEDHKGLSGGMPDLLLWRKPQQEANTHDNSCSKCSCSSSGTGHSRLRTHGEAKLVEVKGPRDRLSEQQRAWILILSNAGLNVEVCKVLENLDEDVKLVRTISSNVYSL